MAGAGRKPNPLHLQVVDKAHAHRYADRVEIEPSSDKPVAPEYLDDEEKEIFNNMVETISELYTPSASHVEMIALYAQNKALAKHLDYQLKHVYASTTYTTEDRLGNPVYKAYPEVMQLQNARRACSDILKEFGLTPSSQRTIPLKKKETKVNAFADLDEVNG